MDNYEDIELSEAVDNAGLKKVLATAKKIGAKIKGNTADFGEGAVIEFSIDNDKLKMDGGKHSGVEHFDTAKEAIDALTAGMDESVELEEAVVYRDIVHALRLLTTADGIKTAKALAAKDQWASVDAADLKKAKAAFANMSSDDRAKIDRKKNGKYFPKFGVKALTESVELEEAAAPFKSLEAAWLRTNGDKKKQERLIKKHELKPIISKVRPGAVKLGVLNKLQAKGKKPHTVAGLDADGELIFVTNNPTKIYYPKANSKRPEGTEIKEASMETLRLRRVVELSVNESNIDVIDGFLAESDIDLTWTPSNISREFDKYLKESVEIETANELSKDEYEEVQNFQNFNEKDWKWVAAKKKYVRKKPVKEETLDEAKKVTVRMLRQMLFKIDSSAADKFRSELFYLDDQDSPATGDQIKKAKKIIGNKWSVKESVEIETANELTKDEYEEVQNFQNFDKKDWKWVAAKKKYVRKKPVKEETLDEAKAETYDYSVIMKLLRSLRLMPTEQLKILFGLEGKGKKGVYTWDAIEKTLKQTGFSKFTDELHGAIKPHMIGGSLGNKAWNVQESVELDEAAKKGSIDKLIADQKKRLMQILKDGKDKHPEYLVQITPAMQAWSPTVSDTIATEDGIITIETIEKAASSASWSPSRFSPATTFYFTPKGNSKRKKFSKAKATAMLESVDLEGEIFNEAKDDKQKDIEDLEKMIKNPDPSKVKQYGGTKYVDMLKKKLSKLQEDKDPCWKGYKQVGMKTKDGKKVPNCVDEKLDAVGKEDDDVDNDGDTDASDKYLKKRRKAITKATKKDK